MSIMDLIDKARELIGEGGVDALGEKAGELSDIAQGEGSILDKAQQAVEGVSEGGSDVADASGDASARSER